MTAPVYACARCGNRERTDNTFLCSDCLRSRKQIKEKLVVQRLHPLDGNAQRAALIKSFGWAGWQRRLKAGGRA